jgi:aldose 1-epimerase
MTFARQPVPRLAVQILLAVGFGLVSMQHCNSQTSALPNKSADLPMVGGENILTLVRNPTTNGLKPEFLSLTLLPGRGMNLFQITAFLPGKGEVKLLQSPSIDEAARLLNGSGQDAFGNLNHSFGAAFLIPFSSRISGEVSQDGTTIATSWRGHTITLPNDFLGKYAVHGLINQAKAEDIHTVTTAEGQTATAVIHAGSFDGHWLSKTALYFTIVLTGSAIDVTVTAKNVGNQPEPMAIGWHPYLAIPSGDRSQARIHIPAATIARLDDKDGLTTGDLDTVARTPRDFSAPEGRTLDESLNNNFSHLMRTNGIVDAWLIDPKSNYGIRVEGLSPHINTIHVYSPKNGAFAAIEEQFNFQDPFGTEWKGMDTGMVPLNPGQSVTWKVRLEIFEPSKDKK